MSEEINRIARIVRDHRKGRTTGAADELKRGSSLTDEEKKIVLPPGSRLYINGKWVTCDEPTEAKLVYEDYDQSQVELGGDLGDHPKGTTGWLLHREEESREDD